MLCGDMDWVIVSLTALLAAALTLFSGFGLGTLLMPGFAVFFPLPVAVAATAVVHLANNLFKLALVGQDADWRVAARFGIPAALAALVGAALLQAASVLPVLVEYRLGERICQVTVLKLAMAAVIIGFAVYELHPRWSKVAFDAKWLPWGGVLSGFFGGLSGHQGALRSAFLLRAGLSKEAFIATGVVGAVIVDTVRLGVYGAGFYRGLFVWLDPHAWALVGAASVAAFLGSYLGAKLVAKVTLRKVQVTVAVLLGLLAVGMGVGLV
ncbi:MAG: hypothetical protein RL514_325 [Verrucomicrobiota bacterium]